MSLPLPHAVRDATDCTHRPPDDAIQIEPGLWCDGGTLYVFEDEFLGDRGMYFAAAAYRYIRRAGMKEEGALETIQDSLILAGFARFQDAFPEAAAALRTVRLCPHASPEGATR